MANEHIMHIAMCNAHINYQNRFEGKDLPMTMGVMEEFTITKSMVDKGII
jgi:hypothetical protein